MLLMEGETLSDGIKKVLNTKKEPHTILIIGKPQTGKSRVGLKLCEKVDPKFRPNERVSVMDKARYMYILNRRFYYGAAIMFDEVGVGMSNLDFWDFIQRSINFSIQTEGHERLLQIFTTVIKKSVDPNTRRLVDAIITTLKLDRKKGYCLVKYEELDYNQKLDKMYYHFPRQIVNGRIHIIDKFKIYAPSPEIDAEYEALEKPAKYALKARMMADAERLEIEKDRQLFDVKKAVEEVISSKEKYLKDYYGRKFIDKNMIMTNFNVGRGKAGLVQKSVMDRLGM